MSADHERLYRMLLENSSDIVVQNDVEGRIVWVSPSVTEQLGWSSEHLLGRTADWLVHPDDVERLIVARQASIEGVATRFEMRLRRLDGDHVWFSSAARRLLDLDGRPMGRVVSLRNIHAEVLARAALEASEASFRFLVENASDIVVQQVEGIPVFVSPAITPILGWTPEDLLGRPVTELWHPDDQAEATALRHESMYGSGGRAVMRMRHKDGSYRWLEVSARPVRHPDGRPGAVGILRDVTERIAVMDALADSERAATAANLAKTSFLSRMSHELRTPLNAVLGFAQLLQLDDLSPSQEAATEQILVGGRHLLDLINEVLDVSRIEAGRMSMDLEPVPIGSVVRDAADMVRMLAIANGIDVQVIPSAVMDDLALVDRQRTTQILLNLLTNAVKYNREGGGVRVRCRCAEQHLEVDVEDEGAGIPADMFGRLFEPFDRLGAEKTGIEGTGIGLALARGLAEMMHGRLDVRSTVGVGSVFTLSVPRAEAAPGPAVLTPPR